MALQKERCRLLLPSPIRTIPSALEFHRVSRYNLAVTSTALLQQVAGSTADRELGLCGVVTLTQHPSPCPEDILYILYEKRVNQKESLVKAENSL